MTQLRSCGADGTDLFEVRAQHADNQATMGVRLPTILAKAINDVYETLNQIVSAGEDWLT